jgi:hypothetical protein
MGVNGGFQYSSITKNGTGDYTVNQSVSGSYSSPSYGWATNSNDRALVYFSSSTSTLRVQNRSAGNSFYDQTYLTVVICN